MRYAYYPGCSAAVPDRLYDSWAKFRRLGKGSRDPNGIAAALRPMPPDTKQCFGRPEPALAEPMHWNIAVPAGSIPVEGCAALFKKLPTPEKGGEIMISLYAAHEV